MNVLLVAWLWCPLAADPPAPSEEKSSPRYETRDQHDPNGIGKFYMGREIARVMGHQGADWLDRPEREAEEEPRKLVDLLKIEPGLSVADIGAGTGYVSFLMAEKVGSKGTVYAVDIQQEMLDIIAERAKKKDITNVKPIMGKVDDPSLPESSVDLIIMVDVYHEFEWPYEMTEAMVKSLKTGGRLVFVEYRLEDPSVPIKLVHKMSQKQVIKEMESHALRWKGTLDQLPRQHVIIFEKTEEQASDE